MAVICLKVSFTSFNLHTATLVLQRDFATLSDVFFSCIAIDRMQKEQTLLNSLESAFSGQNINTAIKGIFDRRFKFIYHPAHLVCCALDPRYTSKIPGDINIGNTIRFWLKKFCQGDEQDKIIRQYGEFRRHLHREKDLQKSASELPPVQWWQTRGLTYKLV